MRSVSFCTVLVSITLFGCPQDPDGNDDPKTLDGMVGADVGDRDGGGGDTGGGGNDDMATGPRACADGEDNDGDDLIDLDDPGCENARDNSEEDPAAPQCADGMDNDNDGFVDFPQDPGCGSSADDDEVNDPVAPQCNDGIDNERDGLIDEQDPGCASVADPSEADPAEPPECFDGLDNDVDGVIDFPHEPGCSAAGDDSEMDPPQPAPCGNGVDDDDDGLVDFPDDPGCAGVGDGDETDKPVTPACADGIDNDRDGKTDYPDDDGCEAAADYNERGSCGDTYDPPSLRDGAPLVVDSSRGVFESQGSCGGAGSPEVVFQYRLERDVEALTISTEGGATVVPTTLYVRRSACLDPDSEEACQREAVDKETFGHTLTLDHPRRGDLYIFADGVAGEGGNVQITVTEVPLAQCLNGLDDDEDGRTDYPSDPGCETRDDRDEMDEDQLPVCADDEDNDGDGLIDYPNDPGCISAGANDEVDRCGAGVRFRQFFAGDEFVIGDTREVEGGARNTSGSCGGQTGPEIIYLYRNRNNARLVFTTRHPETMVSTVLYIRRDCGDSLSELGCDDGEEAGGMQGEIEIEQAAVGDYWIFVDTRFGMGGPFKLSVEVERLDPGCSDGLDNDEDGRVDGDDPGCVDAQDEDERNAPGDPDAACNNGGDDDGDNLIDFPFDPGCLTRGDDDEEDGEATQCSNGEDDDEDGLVDFPIDPGCQARGDDTEEDGLPRPQCSNRIDDDQDDFIDYPLDPGCYAAGDRTEAEVGEPSVCFNMIDDDRDGIADFPFDQGCESAGDNTEEDLDEAPVCSNGEDDDEDGITDFPLDPGCRYAADPDEESPRFPPECANGNDDDADGRADFPDDPGCRFAADRREVNAGAIPPRCSDGVDNDFDGSIDLQDLGCLDGEDDDEEDGEGVPLCGNGEDDDGDDLADWPDDPGCQARGDLTEDQSCRPEVDTPLIPRNGTVQGATEEGGVDNYHNRCGGRMAPELVYRYVLEEQADLTFSADNDATDYPVVISVRNDCEEPDSQLACAGNFAVPSPEVTLRDAEPGEYYVFIDGGGPEQWVSSGGNVNLADPRGFMANQDLRDGCGWSDGGNDAFDCFGRTLTLSHAGATSANISPVLGNRAVAAGAYRANFESDFVHQNIWRLQFTPQEDFDDRLVDITMAGNLGSDGGTQGFNQSVMFQGRQINYLVTSDGPLGMPRFDPPVVHFVLPSDPEQLDNVEYVRANDNVTYNVRAVKLPVTIYVGIGYAAHGDVVQAILSDVEIQAGPEGNDAPRFGNFELSVTEE